MKKVLVLVVFFVLFAGVIPANADIDVYPVIPEFEEEIFDLLRTSRKFHISNIKSIDAENKQLSIDFCVYGTLSPCLTVYVTDNTIIRILEKRGLGSVDDLELGQGAVIEYYLQDGVAYASRLLASKDLFAYFGRVEDIDAENRTITVCVIIFGHGCMDHTYVPYSAIITFEWDEKRHEFDDLLIGDHVRTFNIRFDDADGWVTRIIHVTSNENREHINEIPTQNHITYAPLIVHKR